MKGRPPIMEGSPQDIVFNPLFRGEVDRLHIKEGQLFGYILTESLAPPEVNALLHAGWTMHNFQDGAALEPPVTVLNWAELRQTHRERTWARIAERWQAAGDWSPRTRQILEELIASHWEERQDELRPLLSAWAFASTWNQPHERRADPDPTVEGEQVYFFYTESFRRAASEALESILPAPEPHDEFWTMAEAVRDLEVTG